MIAYLLESELEFQGVIYRLNLPFDAVLRFYDLQRECDLLDADRIDIALDLLVDARDAKKAKNLSAGDRVELLRRIHDDFITPKGPRASNSEPLLDFSQDAAHIFSSFLMDYGIDLVEEQGRLDWRKFIALLQGLSERTKIREIMSIRARKIPAPTAHNAEEIRALQEAKAFYALRMSPEDARANFQRQLDQFGATLERLAKPK